MARRINYSARYKHHTVEQVYAALSDRDYWETIVEEMRQFSPNHIENFSAGASGIEIEFQHIIPRELLPEIAQGVMRKDMVITRKQSFSSLDTGASVATGKADAVTGKYEASVPAGPGSLTGTMRLFTTETGCTLRTTSEAKVYIPMMGPRLEQLMLINVIDLFRAEAAATLRWLNSH